MPLHEDLRKQDNECQCPLKRVQRYTRNLEFRFLFLLDIGAKIEKPVNDNIRPNDPIPIQSNGIF